MGFEKFSKEYFGTNYEKAKRNYEAATLREKLNFQRNYSSANLENFLFDADISKTGDVIRTMTRFKGDESLPEITSYFFKTYYSDFLYWQPRLWGPSGTVQKFTSNFNSLPYDSLLAFRIYVDEKQSFLSNFENLNTSWKGTENDITKVAVKEDDPYFCSLLSACVLSHVGGLSRKHFVENEKIPKIITSIARFALYYHMKRFLKDSRKLSSYLTEDLKDFVKSNLQVKKTWQRKFVRTRANLSYWYQNHPNKRNIRKYRYVMTKNHTGVLGIEYEELDRVLPRDEQKDWMLFIKEDSDGFTKTGQKLLQMAVESYVYCVLGSQAKTRWSIVGQGAKSLQTQDIFHSLVKDTLIQDDPVKLISDMRTAIDETNVLLNLVICPGIVLIPSSMIFLKEKVKGYNNILTLATKEMKFGVNKDVNKVKPVSQTENESVLPQKPLPVIHKTEEGYSVLPTLGITIVFGFLIAKYII